MAHQGCLCLVHGRIGNLPQLHGELEDSLGSMRPCLIFLKSSYGYVESLLRRSLTFGVDIFSTG